MSTAEELRNQAQKFATLAYRCGDSAQKALDEGDREAAFWRAAQKDTFGVVARMLYASADRCEEQEVDR